ncbi:proline--tRNA ligase [Candidatus Fermentibacteria bacterium]|nr:proline--tRNA ligase [Candidatus Fermentibacteria bacterium]
MAENITPRKSDYSQWYQDVIREAELADSAPVRGCMVIRPWGYAIWENIQKGLDARFRATGHENVYFPLFIPQSFLQKEAEHVEGFSPELAVVTHGGGKRLEEPLVVRPTSETIINHFFSKWIGSYRDLPMLLNQWANVVRWELRPRAFIRTTEFLWQEGHTAHATEAEARAEAVRMLRVYEEFARKVLAVPVIAGRKTEREKFAGAVESYSIESMSGNGWALQSGTSHYLGTNFARAFNTRFLDENNEQQYVHQSSWGVSTRLVGAVITAHGDDHGLKLPPEIAPRQVAVVPIWKSEAEKAGVLQAAERIASDLEAAGIRTKLDDRDTVSPGFKFNHWEVRGVPLRFEVGPKDLAGGHVTASARNRPGREGKFTLPFEGLAGETRSRLASIQSEMLADAEQRRDAMTYEVRTYEEFKAVFEEKPGFYRLWWAGGREDEERLQEETRATVRNIPLDQPDAEGTCFMTGRPARSMAIVARAY